MRRQLRPDIYADSATVGSYWRPKVLGVPPITSILAYEAMLATTVPS